MERHRAREHRRGANRDIGEGKFNEEGEPSGSATPVEPPSKKRKGVSKKAKSVKEKLAIIDGGA